MTSSLKKVLFVFRHHTWHLHTTTTDSKFILEDEAKSNVRIQNKKGVSHSTLLAYLDSSQQTASQPRTTGGYTSCWVSSPVAFPSCLNRPSIYYACQACQNIFLRSPSSCMLLLPSLLVSPFSLCTVPSLPHLIFSSKKSLHLMGCRLSLICTFSVFSYAFVGPPSLSSSEIFKASWEVEHSNEKKPLLPAPL